MEEELRKYSEHLEEKVEERTAELNDTVKQLQGEITERKQAEEALRESEQRYRQLFEGVGDGIMVLGSQGNFIDCNEITLQYLGYNREEFLLLTPADIVHPDFHELMKDNQKKIWAGEATIIELIHITKDGREIPVEIIARRIDYGGELAILAVIHDITERKQVEEALRESGKEYRTLVEEAIVGIMNVDITGKITYVNKTILQATGYSWEELVGKNAFRLGLVSGETIKVLRKRMKEKLLGQPPGLMEIQYQRKDGEWIWLQIRGRLLRTHNIPVGIQIIGEEITERKQAEEALRESEEKFSKAFRSSPEIITISRLSDGTFLEVNDSFTRVTGYTRKEITDHSSLELDIWVKPGDGQKMLKLLKEKGRVSNEEYSFRTKSGDIRTMLFSAEQINIGHEVCLLAIAVDITELRKIEVQAREAEYLRELDRLRTELLANISHELRTPLASIKGFATMLLDYDRRLKHDEKRDYLETIDKNTDRLVELIEQLLEMSRLEAGMLSITKKPTSISRLCREIIAEARVRSSTHKFTLDIPAKLPRVNFDGKRIWQVLDNIIDNAVKYSDDGTEVNLTVRQEGPELLFTVTDHGIGIPRNDLPRVFNRMFHSPKKSGATGAGLGLSICKGLVEAHGGKIWIESEEGKGTSCFFTLPLDTGKGEQK
ncbi:Adaptive-response sensory-kinase SasA [subsurface metagenome]